ncbi:DmsC/YnfH family molybdoenzyme membrane anchor subunit [Desulfosporosinus sp. FKB]|uniref:dimethyl sulfoxide reductase anchor subunit family protein n=1 Tax=Desulfosporosinus sp. FKB TaxID=1969835 RepID=UPI000B49C208|nr:DmsC/YnfH family molybdoenzyme membrane anchor subunit [Desulfosporosinus sp. FKB]
MFAQEWPLMMFTLVSQLAIGSFLMLMVVRSLLLKQNPQEAAKLTQPGFKAVVGIMVVALVLSLFHLGTPTGAYRSILNLKTSWLSREILTAGGFLVLSFISYQAFQKEKASSALGWITSLVGLAAVLSMSNIYSHSVRPAWMNADTYVAFFGATLALGSAGCVALVIYGGKGMQLSEKVAAHLKKISLITGAAVILPLIYLPVFIRSLDSGDMASVASAQLLTGSYLFPLILRGLISLVGAGLLYYALKQTRNKVPIQKWVYGSLALIAVGEFVGRYVFYGSAVSIMIGLK